MLVVLIAAGALATAAPAVARPTAASPVAELNIPEACGPADVVSSAVGVSCGVASNGGALIQGGKQLVTGNVGGAVSTVVGAGAGSVVASASTALGLAAVSALALGSAASVLHEAAVAIGATTAPQLQSTWFSSTYWRMAAIAALLTLPFLFAATVQAALRSDVGLLARAAFGYLPLAMLSIAIAAPVTMLLLAASDEMCALISAAASNAAPHVLLRTATVVGALSVASGSPFLAFLIGLLIIGAAFALWIELLLREAAVYVVVLMLPVAFAALTWPARRIWAIRAVELLVALILSKFAIVAVLSLGGAAIDASVGHGNVTAAMAGAVLIMLATLSPWALLRLVPLAEIATGTTGALRGELRSAGAPINAAAAGYAEAGADWVRSSAAEMRQRAAMRMAGGEPDPGGGGPDPGGGEPDPGGGEPDPGGGEPDPGGGGPDPGCPADPVGPTHGGPPDAPSPPSEPPPPSREVPWNERHVIELGPDMGYPQAYPHPDADDR